MKNKFKFFGIAVVLAIMGFTIFACSHGSKDDDQTFTSAADFTTWLGAQPTNTPATAYNVKLNVSDLGGDSSTPGSVGEAIKNGYRSREKYLNLDLSGSTITNIEDFAFFDCTSLISVTIPSSVTRIGRCAFRDCTSLANITIPSSITSIGYGAFASCYSLANITIPDSVTSIEKEAFDNTAWYNNQPSGVVYAGKLAYQYKGVMPANTSITLLDGTKGIADSAFENRTNLTSITIPNGVTSIGERTFQECTSLNSITIPDSVIGIGDWAFYYCISLTSVTIPSSVTRIGNVAFASCHSLANITIPSSVTRIGERAFFMCTSLTSVTFAAGSNISNANFGESAFPEDGGYHGNDSLKTAYAAGKAGTYTRAGDTWTKT